ncbi:MAG: transposase family protein [Nodosilinea sp.]
MLNDVADCPDCGQSSGELHQSRAILVRDLSIFGQATHLKVPRRVLHASKNSYIFDADSTDQAIPHLVKFPPALAFRFPCHFLFLYLGH